MRSNASIHRAAGGDRLDWAHHGGGRVGGRRAAGLGARRLPVRGKRVTGLTASASVRCATARQVAAAYDTAVLGSGSFPDGRIRVAGYTCTTSPVGGPEEETFTVRCTRRGGVVRFG